MTLYITGMDHIEFARMGQKAFVTKYGKGIFKEMAKKSVASRKAKKDIQAQSEAK